MKIIEHFLTNNPCYTANVEAANHPNDKDYAKYLTFQQRGPLGITLHSIGCAQPSAAGFVRRWNNATYDRACVHAFIDANSADIYQTLPWNFRGWQVGGSANNTHIGVEMCESSGIKYRGVSDRFDVIDKDTAWKHAETAYKAAVELFAYICKKYDFDPLKDGVVLSHNESGKRGIGSKHTDPEHYWDQLGIGYTMNGFRKDVKAAMAGAPVTPTVTKPATQVEKTSTRKIRYLSKGMEGNDVKTLQGALNAWGFDCGKADGDFGPKTETALKKFQRAYKLGADGIAGDGTWGKLLSK